MHHISIISSSVRIGRNSHRLALYFQNYLAESQLATTEILDLHVYNFPIFEERIWNLKNPSPALLDFSSRIKQADGIILVTPEYNGGYPASLKNAIDVLYDEWHKKPIAIACASDGKFGGTQVLISLQWSLFKMHAWTVPARFHASIVQDIYKEDGTPVDKEKSNKVTAPFIKELLWCIEAKRRMEE